MINRQRQGLIRGLIRRTGSAGFTLAELLISLLIIGVIATFTIPKIITAQQNSKRISIFKETIANAQAIIQQNYTNGNIQIGGTQNASYILNGMNAVQVCSSNAQTQGCWTQAMNGNLSGESGEPGLVLHNGATIIGLQDTVMSAPHGYAGFGIDWNGASGTNTEGDDQIEVVICWETLPGCWSGDVKTGTVSPRSTYTASYNLYTSIFNQ